MCAHRAHRVFRSHVHTSMSVHNLAPRGLLRGTESYLSFLIELKKKKTTTTPTDAVKLDFIKPEDLRGASYLVI